VSYGISELITDYERIEQRTRMMEIADRARRDMMLALQQNFVGRPITGRTIQEIAAFLAPYESRLQSALADPSIRVEVHPNPSDPYDIYVDVTRSPMPFPRPRYVVIFVERPFIV
jgi:hypothetical protein